MPIYGIGSTNNLDTLACWKTPKKPQEEANPEPIPSGSHFFDETQHSPEEVPLNDLIESTIYPGQKNKAVAVIAAILTHINNPFTGDFFLDPLTFAKMPEADKMELSGPIMDAIKSFQGVYMELYKPDGSLGIFEYKRLFTIDTGVMLTQITKRKTGKPYLDPEEFNALPCGMQVKMLEGAPNPIYKAFKDFLMDNLQAGEREKIEKLTAITIISLYHSVWNRWKELNPVPLKK